MSYSHTFSKELAESIEEFKKVRGWGDDHDRELDECLHEHLDRCMPELENGKLTNHLFNPMIDCLFNPIWECTHPYPVTPPVEPVYDEPILACAWNVRSRTALELVHFLPEFKSPLERQSDLGKPLETALQTHGENHPDIAIIRKNLDLVRGELERDDNATKYYVVAKNYITRGTAYKAQTEYHQANIYYSEAFDICKNIMELSVEKT